MNKKTIFFIFLVAALLLLAGCTKKECTKDAQCTKEGYEGKCAVNYKCTYDKLCGTKVCKGSQGQYLKKECADDGVTCLITVPKDKVKPTTIVNEQTASGDKFKITTSFNQPLNTRKDFFETTVKLSQQSPTDSEIKIERMELTGKTKDNRIITLSEQKADRYLWTEGSEVKVQMIIDPQTTDYDGELTELTLKVYYNYVQTTGAQKQTKENTIQQKYSLKFTWVRPETPYACPDKCPKETPAMKGSCDSTTGFCEYTPVPNQCGNYICEQNENKCNCAEDCGPCSGNIGVYTYRTCTADNKCVGTVKQGTTATPKQIFDDRQLGIFHLQNNYKYNNPFNIKTDKFNVEINLYELKPEVSGVKIETIRLLDGQQQIAELGVNKDLASVGSKITEDITITPQATAETDRMLTIAVWYQYTQNGQVQKNKFEKQLEKTTILSPE